MQYLSSFTLRRSTIWFRTGIPWSTNMSMALTASGVISQAWLNCVESCTLYFLRRPASSSSILNGRVASVLVPTLITSTWPIWDTFSKISSSLSFESSNASPPVISTSLMVSLFFMNSIDSSISSFDEFLSCLPISLRR